MKRLFALVFALAIIAAACGVDREAEGSLDNDESETAASDSGEDPSDDEDSDEAAEESEDSGASADEQPSAEAPPPPTTAPANEVAATVTLDGGDEIEVLHGDLNELVIPTIESPVFSQMIFGGAIPAGFDASVLGELVFSTILDGELDKLDAAADSAVVSSTEDEIRAQILSLVSQRGSLDPEGDVDSVFAETPYLEFIVTLQARQIALGDALVEANPGDTEVPCASHILVETEEEAEAVVADLEGGADFAATAQEKSTGPSGPTGGDLGCTDPSGFVPEFADAVTNATEGEIVGPVQTQFGFHVIIVTGSETVEPDPVQLLAPVLDRAIDGAEIEIDGRVGSWDSATRQIVPAGLDS